MYTVYHPTFTPERWQIFIAYLVIVWIDTAIVCFGQKYLAIFSNIAGIACVTIVFVITMVVAIMPSQTGFGYASNAFVWTKWQNLTGWSSDGLVFLMGMLNGAYAIGTPDAVCHLCEELPRPRVNIPKGIASQLSIGFLTTFVFYIAIVSGLQYLGKELQLTITTSFTA